MWESVFYWVTVYLLIGMVCGLSLTVHRFVMEHRPKDFDWPREIRSWRRFIRKENWNFYALKREAKGILGFALTWPLLPPVILLELSRPWYRRELLRFQNTPAHQFKCQSIHLTKKIKPEEAEADNWFQDPLGKVPPISFGHLHPGWIAFLSIQTPKLTLWEFEIPEDRHWYPRWFEKRQSMSYCYKGYALVKGRSVRAEFFTEWNGKQ